MKLEKFWNAHVVVFADKLSYECFGVLLNIVYSCPCIFKKEVGWILSLTILFIYCQGVGMDCYRTTLKILVLGAIPCSILFPIHYN